MKKTQHRFLFLIAVLLCVGALSSLLTKYNGAEGLTVKIEEENHDRICAIQAADWNVSSAENSLSSHNGPTYKTDEDYTKRKKQKLILAAFSQIQFMLAKIHSENESLTSKQKRGFSSITTANRQLRL